MTQTEAHSNVPRVGATAQGLLAILFWGSTIAFSRRLTETLGIFTAAASIFLVSGGLGCGHLLLSPTGRRALARLPRAYWIGCGALFSGYMVALYLAVGLAQGRQQVVEVGMLNYLWPSLTLILSTVILGKRARWTLWPGTVLATGGVVLVMLQSGPWSWESFVVHLEEHQTPFLLALTAAVCWGLYSNLARRWAGTREGNAVPLFLLATGLILLALRLARPERSHWSVSASFELAYMALFPTLLAYVFWDRAMRKGHVVLVASASYGAPLLSTAISCAYLDVPMGIPLWLGCALTVVGAVVCSRSLTDRKRPSREAPRALRRAPSS